MLICHSHRHNIVHQVWENWLKFPCGFFFSFAFSQLFFVVSLFLLLPFFRSSLYCLVICNVIDQFMSFYLIFDVRLFSDTRFSTFLRLCLHKIASFTQYIAFQSKLAGSYLSCVIWYAAFDYAADPITK